MGRSEDKGIGEEGEGEGEGFTWNGGGSWLIWPMANGLMG
jgi:hypothetical protein